MTKQLDFIRYARSSIVKIIDEMPLGQVNKIPAGFGNNLAWQLGHAIVTQQVYCYVQAGLAPVVGDGIMAAYANGTKPDAPLDAAQLAELKELAVSTLDRLAADLESGRFANYAPRTLGSGITVASIGDALDLLVFHEGMHLGECKILKRMVQAG